MEPFFSLLQKNVLNRKRWETRAELRLDITPGSSAATTESAANAPSDG
jgi:hypothetical protein